MTRTWRGSKGPLANAVLSLRRIGWRADGPFRRTDDRQQAVILADYSPNLLCQLLRDGVQRQLERDMGGKLGFGVAEMTQEPVRALVDVARAMLRSSTLDARGKGLVRALFCGSLWTTQRARECGYDIEVKCAMCGGPRDDVAHRLRCTHPDVVAARAGVRTSKRFVADFVSAVDATGAEARAKWERGVVPHPVHWYPKPAVSHSCWGKYPGGPVLNSDAIPADFNGDFFWDGSADRCVIRDLRRAWAGCGILQPGRGRGGEGAGAGVGYAAPDGPSFRVRGPCCSPVLPGRRGHWARRLQ